MQRLTRPCHKTRFAPNKADRPWLDKLKAHDFLAVTDSDMADMPKLQLMFFADALQQAVEERDSRIAADRLEIERLRLVEQIAGEAVRERYGPRAAASLDELRSVLGGRAR